MIYYFYWHINILFLYNWLIGIEKLKKQREVICQQIIKEEESKKKIEAEIAVLSSKLNALQESLNKKTKAKMEYDQLIQQTENAFTKVYLIL